MGAQTNRRGFSRVHSKVDAEVILPGGRSVRAHVIDVGMSGVLLDVGEELKPGVEYALALVLTGIEPEIRIAAKGKVARADDNGVAIGFTEVDVDGFEHLQRLILMNADDAEQAEEEMGSSLGIKRHADDF